MPEEKEQPAGGREKILAAAIRVFAQKSFDGARIDEIAREAGVPKSLIYYHFKSKDEILEVLTRQFIDEYTDMLREVRQDSDSRKAQLLGERMKSLYMGFEKRHADLIRVMLLGSLKKDGGAPVLFRVTEAVTGVAQGTAAGDPDAQERLAAEFFTRLIPNYAYICFGEQWAEYFHIEREELDRLFVRLMVDTHGSYHKNHPNAQKEEHSNGNDHVAKNSGGSRGA